MLEDISISGRWPEMEDVCGRTKNSEGERGRRTGGEETLLNSNDRKQESLRIQDMKSVY